MRFCVVVSALASIGLVSCGGGSEAPDHQAPNSSASNITQDASPAEVAGTTTSDVSTIEAYIAALAPAFISGNDNAIAAVAFPNREMLISHIRQHNGPANAQAAITMLDDTMGADVMKVVSSMKAARQAAIESGFDPENASFDSAEKVSGLSIGGMKINTLGMNLKSGDRVYRFELKESRDILGRWVTMGGASFEGVTSGKPLSNEDGSLDLNL